MDGEEENLLEKFRDNWRTELKRRKSSTSNSHNKPTHDCDEESERVNVTNEEDRHNSPLVEDGHRNAHVVEGSSCSTLQDDEFRTIYQPFSIVGNLLKNSHHEAVGHKSKELDWNETYSKNVAKRQKKQDIGEGAKRSKKQLPKDIFNDRSKGELPEESLLDKLIADIDEITDIPFFDISLPREVAVNIFQHLSMKDLCHCAQVSKSWKSLAEDELLWCRVCHGLGQETIYTTREKTNWKQIVQHNVERQRLLVTNWKGRVGQLTKLEHVKGRLLCGVHSYQDQVVAGYASGEVKLWNLSEGTSCVFQPSDMSLIIDEDPDREGTEQNMLHHVVTANTFTAAAYTHGNVDIWSLESGTQPIQTYTPQGRRSQPSEVCLSGSGQTLVISYGPFIDVLSNNAKTGLFESIEKLDALGDVKHVKLYEDVSSSHLRVVYSRKFSAYIFQPKSQNTTESYGQVTEIHNLIGAPISTVDFKTDQSLLGIGLESYGGLVDGFRIKLYDLKTGQLTSTLHGHTWVVTCMNMVDSPLNELVTGSGDRKLRVFDIRQDSPVQTFSGHTGSVTCVQMDAWKLVSGAQNGFVCVWDRRMGTKLWEMHNRHPVRYIHYNDKTLVAGNVPIDTLPQIEEFEFVTHRRYRGSVVVYDFLADLTTKDVPEICLSTYDQPEASRYNISLAVPYDVLTY